MQLRVTHQLPRVRPSQKVDLRAVLVADAGELPLIQQGPPDLAVRLRLDPGYSLLDIEVIRQEVRSEIPHLHLVLAGGKHADQAQPEPDEFDVGAGAVVKPELTFERSQPEKGEGDDGDAVVASISMLP